MFEQPSFLVQLGHHGRKRVTFGIDHSYIDGAILSPSDYIRSTLKETAEKLSNESLITLFDPQFYLPSQGDRDKQNRYDYHNKFGGEDYYSGLFINEDDREIFFEDLIDLQNDLECDAYISPASYISSLSSDRVDDWHQNTEFFLDKVQSYGRDIPTYATLAVSGDHLTDESLRDYLLSKSTSLDIDGFYVSVMYDDADSRLPLRGRKNVESYLKTLLSLTYNRYSVIAANTHQISHLLFPIGVDAFASGHYNNLRSFDTGRWVRDPSPQQRPATRYYSDKLLDRVRPDHMLTEIAEETSINVEELQADSPSPWEDDLFDSGSVDVGWPDSKGGWDHYIYSCGRIAEQYRGKDKDARVQHTTKKIQSAKSNQETILAEIDDHTDELDPGYLDDWEAVFDEITSTKQFKRLS